MKKISICKIRLFLCIAFIHWGITFYTDHFIFTITNERLWFYILIKICSFVLIVVIWKKIVDVITKCRKNDKKTIQRLVYGCNYATILFLMLLAVWPGIWRTDEFGVLGNVISLQIYWWQHFLTSIFYILSLMLIPNPVGVIIVQIILVSMGFGYLAELFEYRTGKKWSGFLLLLPFCIPSVIMFQLYPMRITLYSILELVIAFFLYVHLQDHKQIEWIHIIWLALGTAVLANWRTESFYYIILLPLYFFCFLNKNILKQKQFIFYLTTVLILSMSIWVIQNKGLHNDRNDAYEITAYAQSLPCLVQAAYNNHDENGLAVVNKIIDVDAVLQAKIEGKEGIECFWEGDMSSKKYSHEEFNGFRKQYFIWCMQYYKEFFEERTHNFLTSYEQTKSTADLYDEENLQFVFFLQTFNHVNPLFPNLREKLILFMEQKKWCIFEIPIIMGIFSIIYYLFKNKKYGLLWGMIFIRIPLIYLTAPDNYFMYYYPFLLAGIVISCFCFSDIFRKC
ncbi:MAG: hypothetical protein PUD03_10120 [Lachnospiraceae bacterium]|nr:hypothetical protein [Lachnospiraceae bacterium]